MYNRRGGHWKIGVDINSVNRSFHTCVEKGIFLVKRSRPDIQPTISVLSSRVHNTSVQDLEKLVRLCKYLNSKKVLHLVLSIDGLKLIKCYIDASYAVHEDFFLHSGLVTKFGQGSTISASLKQKLNTSSSTEVELVGVDDFMAMILWTQNCMKAQGYGVLKHILMQVAREKVVVSQLDLTGDLLVSVIRGLLGTLDSRV